MLLSQGSTKVFKDRSTARSHIQKRMRLLHPSPSTSGHPQSSATCQRMTARISKGATLYLFPDPVTCFKHASYNQFQNFYLEDDASLIVLDSFTSGRKSLGEEWEFWRYYSVNDVWVNGQRVAKDVMLLEQEKEGEVKDSRWKGALPARTLADRLAPYSCYATAILYGPAMRETLRDVSQRCEKISVFKQASPPPLLWSFSWVGPEREGGVIRVAAVDTEGVRNSLKELLHTIKPVVGIDTYHKAFP